MPDYTIPSPVTWTSGPFKAGLLRSNVSDAVALLSLPPVFAGAQTDTGQSIPNNTYTAVQIDTEFYDSVSGHQSNVPASNPYYYGMLPGWYLCEASVPVTIPGGSTTVIGASIGGVQNGGSATNYGGQRMAAGSASSYSASACKLMKLQQTGTFGSGDFVSAAVIQANNTSSAETLVNGASVYPYLSARWVAALTGTASLAVPANPAWPVPTSYVTSAFLNSNIRDTIRFLIYPPVFEWSRTGGAGTLASVASIPATGTTVALDTATVDNYSAFSVISNAWTAPVAGVYFCYGCVAVNTGANASSLAAGLTVTSANYNSGTTFTIWGGSGFSVTSGVAAQVARKRLRLNAGDTISLAAAQNDTGSANVTYATGVHVPRLLTVWQGA